MSKALKLKCDISEAPRVTARAATIPDALKNFDDLPDSASVRLPVVCALFACSSATVWRRVKSGAIPESRKFGEKITIWNVSELRQALSEKMKGSA